MGRSRPRVRRNRLPKSERGRELSWQEVVAGLFRRPDLPGYKNQSATAMLDAARDELMNRRPWETNESRLVHLRNLFHAFSLPTTLPEHKVAIKEILESASQNSPIPEIKTAAAAEIVRLKSGGLW